MSAFAISVTAPEVAELVSIEAPAQIGPRQLAGRTLYSLMSPGTELAWYYKGKHFPSFPGYACVFEISEIGEAAQTTLRPGDVVFAMGGHRSLQVADADAVVPLPDGLRPELAPIARLMGVSMTTLMTTLARPGEKVIIAGAGPVGFLAAQIFRHAGYEVLIVEPDAARREGLIARGLDARDAMPLDDAAWAGKVALVVECSGHEAAVLAGCQMVRRLGEVVLVGVPWEQRTELSAHALLHEVFHKYVVLRSGWEWELPRQESAFAPHSIFGNFATALSWLAAGHIDVEGLCEQVNPLDAQAAYQRHLHHQSPTLLTLFDWQQLG